MMNKCCIFLTVTLVSLTATAGYKDWASSRELVLFPHQVAISDAVFTGTAITNREGSVAEFAIDEILWGHLPSTNIQIRCADERKRLKMQSNSKYLVFAFTNNWWADRKKYGYSFNDASETFLSDFLSPTSRPAGNAVFPECRVLSPNGTVFTEGSIIKFDKFEINGTNYWPGTRSFITNFLEITRIQNDNIKAFRKLKSYFYESPESTTIPPWLLRHFHLYYGFRYHGVEPERP